MDDFPAKQISGHTVRIDRTLCIGSGNCVNLAPEVFELDETNIVSFVEAPEDIEPNRLVEACRICPVDALMMIDGAGKQIVP